MWQDNADCRQADPELFFPENASEENLRLARDIAEIYCGSCPVLLDCAQFADNGRHIGIWAGSLRSGPTSDYDRIPLIAEAPELPLTDRRAGVRVGWDAA